MRRGLILAVGGLALAAGCSREPRSAAYFAAHADEADRVLAQCRTGQGRGQECVNALSGPAARENAARLERYRRGFSR